MFKWFIYSLIICLISLIFLFPVNVFYNQFIKNIIGNQINILQINGNLIGGQLFSSLKQNNSVTIQLTWNYCPIKGLGLNYFCVTAKIGDSKINTIVNLPINETIKLKNTNATLNFKDINYLKIPNFEFIDSGMVNLKLDYASFNLKNKKLINWKGNLKSQISLNVMDAFVESFVIHANLTQNSNNIPIIEAKAISQNITTSNIVMSFKQQNINFEADVKIEEAVNYDNFLGFIAKKSDNNSYRINYQIPY